MTLATEKVKTVTERFMLVRLNPARYIEPVHTGSSVYELAFTPKPNRVERNGVALSEITGEGSLGTPSTNDTWLFNDTTGTFKVKLASAPDAETNVIIAYYYLYYTGDIYRAAPETPDDTNTALREWQPRLERYPAVQQSFSNILAGIFTISDVAVSIINEDGSFQSYLSDDDSFYNKDIDIWLCLGSSSNIVKAFSGIMQSLSLTGNSVRIRAVDRLKKLAQPALFGDTVDEAYFRRSASSFANLDPNAHDRPCPYIIGLSSRYRTSTTLFSSLLPELKHISDGLSAYCIDFSGDVTATTNREWGCCRSKSGFMPPEISGVPDYVSHISGGVFIMQVDIDPERVFVGDAIEVDTGIFAIIRHVGTFTYASNDFNIIASSTQTTDDTLFASFVPSNSFGVTILFPDGTFIHPVAYLHYTPSQATITSGGNKFIKITFEDDFEADFAEFGGGFLDPQIHQVIYRISNEPQYHGEVLTDMVEAVGFTANAASFTAADTALPVYGRFQIPYFDELTYKNYLDYAQDILASTLGFLKLNNDGEVEYELLAAPSSTSSRDTRLVIEGATRCEVDYQDITTQIIGFNPHNDNQAALDGADTPADTRENVKAKYLHGFVNVNRFRHVLEELTSRIDAHIGLKSMRRAVYTFDTATEDVETQLGDDLQLDNKIVLGGSETADVKVQGIIKAPGRISIEATDLRGL